MKSAGELLGSSTSFHSYLFNRTTGMITTPEGKELFMENRLRDLFTILLDNLNEFVSKEELMNCVWKDTVVTEQSVPKAISDLRKFLGNHGLSDLNITTIRKLGYRLHVEPKPISESKLASPVALHYILATLLLLIFFLMHH